jgi:hypothetical protein
MGLGAIEMGFGALEMGFETGHGRRGLRHSRLAKPIYIYIYIYILALHVHV